MPQFPSDLNHDLDLAFDMPQNTQRVTRSRKAKIPDIPLPETRAKPGTRKREAKDVVKPRASKRKAIMEDAEAPMRVMKKPTVANEGEAEPTEAEVGEQQEEDDAGGSGSLPAENPNTITGSGEQSSITLPTESGGLRNKENGDDVEHIATTTRDMRPPQKPRPRPRPRRLITGSDSENNDNQDDQFPSSRRGYRQLRPIIRDDSSDADDAIFKGFTSRIPKLSDRKADIDMEDAQ
ncbi:uncharacterized protein LACBIDRAFT_304380 [Laccaria bicolor S238N-H82]|uniref:Predicted protein n=1 Tax=Laccaria bicolor (strain S238N-H82 / ATCC MYA-4686) TaxID=486041 RepID=B0DLI3_LACBS|nr:uncharacterized protein LACBIDRAFT_304380 [Laccaria bicolor S238N-H82]EDR04573.1 predicted protein [Laccaria bicolor S238N-H82]|eukprot:XP_001884745.1 predicted protein [Laccaria bicolor S238N-H82]